MKKEDQYTVHDQEPGSDPEQLITEAIAAYFEKYSIEGKQLVKPGIKSSSVGKNYIYLRTGKYLLAIYNYQDKRFVNLTQKLIDKYSKQ